MNDGAPEKSINEKVTLAITSGQVRMRPRWHYFFLAAFLILGVILVFLILLYLTSFIVFVMRQNGAWFMPVFGLQGIGHLFVLLPWFIIISAAVFVTILEILIQRYQFSYKRPVIYSVSAIIFLAVIGGLLIESTHFHQGLFSEAQNGRLFMAGPFYRQYCLPHSERMIFGAIFKETVNGFQIKNAADETINVVIFPGTRFLSGNDVVVGDKVVIIGKYRGINFNASGVEKINNQKLPLPCFGARQVHSSE